MIQYSRFFLMIMSMGSFFSKEKYLVLLGIVIFTFFGFATRFYHLAEPKAVVFDEFHFFHFVTEYEKGNYFFDIHPPLGKLILWGNAKMYGLEEYVAEIKAKENAKKDLERQMKIVQEKYLTLQKQGADEATLAPIKTQYEHLDAQKTLADQQKTENYDIGKSYNEVLNMWGIRSIPALFGALLIPLLFLFAWELSRNFWAASFVGILAAFDTTLVTESQYVLMDSMLLFAIVLGAFATVKYTKSQDWKWWVTAAIFSAIAVSIKWTGISVIAFVGVVWTWKMIAERSWKKSILQALVYWLTIAIIYIGSFWIHFMLLPHSGTGDAFHTPEFRKNLENSIDYNKTDIVPMEFWGRFIELNVQMGERSAGIRNEHPFASRPEDWVVGEKSIYYWAGPQNIAPNGIVDTAWNDTIGSVFASIKQCAQPITQWTQQIHLFPNPVLWRIFAFAPIFALLLIVWESIAQWKTPREKRSFKWLYILSGMSAMALANILPFVMIARPQFLYHAIEWATFSLLLWSCIIAYISKYVPKWMLWVTVGIFGGGALVFFIVEMPLMYGFSFPECLAPILFGGF